MVAELLRLRLRLVANLFRGPARAVGGRVVGLLVAVVLIALVFAGVRMLEGSGAQFTVRSIVGLGAAVSLGALLLPVIASRTELMPARAFLGYRAPRVVLVPLLAALTLIGPAVLTIPVLLAPLGAWRGADAGLALGCGALLLLQTLLSLRIGAAVGAAIRPRRRVRRWVRAGAVLVMAVALLPALAVILTRAALLIPDRIVPGARIVLSLIRPVDSSPAIDLIAGSPLGVLWAAPGFRLLDQDARVGAALIIGAATIVVLAAVWVLVVALQLRATRPVRRVAATRSLGWFGRTPSTPAGAITARSFSYWMRDPRYRTVVVTLPAIPALMLLAMWVGGVPFAIGVLVPLPFMVLVLAWSTVHNDVAYDHTALWQHLAADTRGVDDRIGRMWPPLAFGAVLVAVGAPLTAWGHGDWAVLPAVLGVSLAVLLGSVGVGSGLSARLPYAAPRPGDGAFRHPQTSSGGSAGAAQGLSLLLVVLASSPALASAGLWLAGVPGPWNWIALLAGAGVGGVTLALGIRGGGRGFDRRGPELLAFTMRN